jgi:hypothetical protein
MSLLSAIVGASRDYAKPIAQAYTSGNRPFTVEVRRPGAGGEPTFDRATGEFVNPEDPLIYRGPGRIHLSGSDTKIEVGEEETPFTSTVISIDPFTAATAGDVTEMPRVDDTVTVVDDEGSRGAHLAGRVFEVTGVERGGHFDIGWRLAVLGAMPSRRGG